ncbi:Beta-1,3-exoglucosidase [Aspergillus mulundensis]|uniref:glucan 1,3-beta-glucosidase n=1 Tax=Aspergillus mulundensis TaxID=1810919 RepID=A0A3D8RR59_9EURO|nr:Beta-1,3-exoglucosidase [Aspergillus mulundensis]RDW76281.1 Beta-1,3-exoglucosidase [Aspergillus mulundensis]
MHPLHYLSTTLLLAACTTCLPSLSHQLPNIPSAKSSQVRPFSWPSTKVRGANLGGWLVQEASLDTAFWNTHAPNAPDEWTLCTTLGSKCSSVLEHRYATFITTSTVDTLASAGVNLLRIPTTYAAWIDLPGSGLYSGNQTNYLREITEYAIANYDMHIIIDVHSLPGGLNGLDIGEKKGNWGWFYNATAWEQSLEVVNAVVEFIYCSSSPWSFTLEPMNEPTDRNGDDDLTMAVFGTPAALSDEAASYVMSFWKAVLERVRALETRLGAGATGTLPVAFQSFKLPSYWGTNFTAEENVVFDVHNYYFEGRNTTSENLPTYMRSDAEEKSKAGGSVPVYVGEWAIQAAYSNSFALRERNLKAGLSIWEEYMQGSAYWSARFEGTDEVDGEGNKSDYWSFGRFVELGYLD